jgi:hypothetical protein
MYSLLVNWLQENTSVTRKWISSNWGKQHWMGSNCRSVFMCRRKIEKLVDSRGLARKRKNTFDKRWGILFLTNHPILFFTRMNGWMEVFLFTNDGWVIFLVTLLCKRRTKIREKREPTKKRILHFSSHDLGSKYEAHPVIKFFNLFFNFFFLFLHAVSSAPKREIIKKTLVFLSHLPLKFSAKYKDHHLQKG